jgi:oligopeptidase B
MARPTPPQAPRRPHVLRNHGDERVDDWYWLRERDDPAVIAHLEAENAYAEAVLAPAAELRDRARRAVGVLHPHDRG